MLTRWARRLALWGVLAAILTLLISWVRLTLQSGEAWCQPNPLWCLMVFQIHGYTTWLLPLLFTVAFLLALLNNFGSSVHKGVAPVAHARAQSLKSVVLLLVSAILWTRIAVVTAALFSLNLGQAVAERWTAVRVSPRWTQWEWCMRREITTRPPPIIGHAPGSAATPAAFRDQRELSAQALCGPQPSRFRF